MTLDVEKVAGEKSSAPECAPAQDQRLSDRTRAVMRVVRVQSADDDGLARLTNISDGSMMLRLQLPVCLGDSVTVCLEDNRSICAQVVWTQGDSCGVRFTTPVDSTALLHDVTRRTRAGSWRPVRLPADAGGVAYTVSGIHPIRVKDISQRGMKVQHHAVLKEGLPIKILLSSGLERKAIVRWARHDLAGIQLLEPLSLDDLGSTKHLD